MQDFQKLKVWELSQELTLEIYRATARFPQDERFALTSQIRRAASSIPANISEGCGRGSGAELARFVQIAIGSSAELESHLLLARDLSYLTLEAHGVLSDKVISIRKMLITFLARVRSSQPPKTHDSELKTS